MKRRLPRPLVGIAAIALLCGAAQAGPRDMPFRATLKISETVSFTGTAPCFAIGLLSGSGQGAYLGQVKAASQDCINPAGVFDPNGPTAYSFTSGSGPDGLVFTASDGAQLFATYAGTLTPRPGAPHAVNGHFVITGGTGRFEAATGGGTLQGSEDISRVVIGEGEITFEGRLAY